MIPSREGAPDPSGHDWREVPPRSRAPIAGAAPAKIVLGSIGETAMAEIRPVKG
jgi:hypothetical protein